ncbi:MAG: rod shape-determining protein RodA [Gammaproteobacteria bacterium]|nr:rod shape-determining protein RodA [Gammaproteobacteria bacterium]
MHSRQTLPQRFHLDVPLLLAILVLAGIGLVVLYSAGGEDPELIVKQGLRFLLALGLMLLVAQIAPQHLAFWAPWFYAGSLVLLILVLAVGDVGKGAQRWLDLGFMRFQPSEMVKVAVPAMVAWYLSERPLPPSLPRLLVAAALIVVPTALIAKQPDLGTSLLVAAAGVFVLLVAGMSWRLILAMGALCAAFLPVLWYFFMRDYQRQRVLTLLNPQSDPLGAGYHIIQSKIAVGSGGVFGKGWLNGTQSQLDFVPERATDFIFAVFSEEFGLVGSLGLLALYLFIVVRGLFLAAEAQETFGRLLGAGLVLTFFVYVFVNIGMVTGLLPVVGVPLPLISYGGTSMVTLMLAFGILMSVHSHRRLLSD